MNQEIKDKLEQAAAYHQGSGLDFMAGAQTILKNPSEWGFCSLEIHKQAVKTFEKITMDAITAEREIVDERNRLQSQLAKYREALERIAAIAVDYQPSIQTEAALTIAKEALKIISNENSD